MKLPHLLTFCSAVLISGCGVDDFIRKNDDRYAKPGAMDSPLTGIYNTYRFDLLDRYRISHQWLESGCSYRGVRQPSTQQGMLSRSFVGRDIVEKDGKTWHRSAGGTLADFDPFVRSVTWVSQEKGKEGQTKEVGLKPVCFEYWWASSHYLSASIRHASLSAYEASFGKSHRLAKWTTRELNGRNWRVAEVPINLLEVRPPNGLGGPYQAWLTELGDTGYVMSIQMGASKESLDHPRAHADIEAVFKHLLSSLKVERISP